MTLIEKVYQVTENNNMWDMLQKRCPVSVFVSGHRVPKVCKSKSAADVTCVDCPRCWTQEYKEEYGEVIIK